MDEKRCAYFFSTNLMRWALHVFFYPFEDLESGDVVDMVDEFSYRLEDLGGWMLDEGLKAGESFFDGGEEKNIYELRGPQGEQATKWISSLEALSRSVGLNESERLYFLFCLECVWIINLIEVYDKLVKGLGVQDLSASYLSVREQFQEQSKWLRFQWGEMAKNNLPQDRVAELTQEMEEACNDLAEDWRSTVFAFARRYSSP